MSINDFDEMPILLCSICISIHTKIQPVCKTMIGKCFLAKRADDFEHLKIGKKSLSRTVYEISVFSCFYAEIHDDVKTVFD